MKRVTSAFAGLCLGLAACAVDSADDTAGTPSPTAGAAGSAMPVGSGGGGAAAGGASGGSTTTPSSGGAAAEPGSGGGNALGGMSSAGAASGGASGKAGAGGTGGASPSGIDFSIWQLQLPTGSGTSPDTVPPKQLLTGFSNAYFFIRSGAQVFMDPKQGITTNGSLHCRSELRESKADGSEAAWLGSATNTLAVSGKVPLLAGGSKGSVTIAQVFVSGENTLAELQYDGSTMKLFYEESKGNGLPVVDLKTPISINTPYTFTLGLSKGVLSVTVNGKQVYTKTPSSAVSGKKFYFKLGNYDQDATAGTPTPTPYTEVEVSSVQVVHN